MKKAVKLTALSLALALGSSVAMAEDNIAFVNVDYLFANHPAREAEIKKLDDALKAPSDKLQAEEKALQDKRKSFEKELDGKVKALEKDAPKLRQADIKKRQDEISKLAKKRDDEFQKLVQAHQKKVEEFRQDAQKRQMEVERKLLTDIQTATTTVAKAKSYSAVLDEKAAIYAADGKNITEEVLKAIPAQAK
ncbi:OmpH family outer membrane protein [Avibacterium avium]|uniref:Outer membrane p25 n=1 Tax=Avibacterium avium TaxID=751 RepID=A0A379ASZ7_AVIAV|nr:OmpH family outer membrane protein [Avibacterium avium]SUB24817.1 outer membrane p25 [Avibacterium avium]